MNKSAAFTSQHSDIHITSAAFGQLSRYCQSGFPFEACGILTGPAQALSGTAAIITDIRPVKNISRHPEQSFVFDPMEWVKTFYDIKKNQQQIVGLFHSHPGGTAGPSIADLAGFPNGLDTTYWIVSLSLSKSPAVYAYRFVEGHFSPLMFTQISV
ncbi:Mov34/MPN/PAD-1 family protein [Paenibacillus abyssi]|uniref:Mov34/MPN/PAD-1 family protein n=2 Tax=Paenibacillus abyssi TaxID=1340531 RepID=A0A917LE91_9BACL|nr:M67 family metallopeptidase [Paenibacillus abyssi]GGG15357.1 Mov34/MPN/PAD-1 family protein [Paenibacillus abyssi]